MNHNIKVLHRKCFPSSRFSEGEYESFQNVYKTNRPATTFLSNYEGNDLAAVELGPQSTSLWIISPPDLDRLKNDLANNITLKVQFKYTVSRITNTEKIAGTVSGERSFDLKDDTPARKELLDMLNSSTLTNSTNANEKRSQLPFLFPKFMKVSEKISKNSHSTVLSKFFVPH